MFDHVVDTFPEVDKPLSAKYFKSFAYPTFKERLPVVIQNIVNDIQNMEAIEEKYGEEAIQEVETIIEKILTHKNNMQTDQALVEVNASGKFTKEVNVYNKLLREKQLQNSGNPASWFQTEWLFAECYLYFKLHEILYNSKTLNNYDPFLQVKIDTFLASKTPVLHLSKSIVENRNKSCLNEEEKKESFIYFLKCALWSNKIDLSLSGGKAVAASEDICKEVHKLDEYILVSDLDETYELLNDSEDAVVDIVLDNAGYELFNDLCFADYLISSGLVKKVIFHGKAIPWFVSDVTLLDFNLIFELLQNQMKCEDNIALAKEWSKYLKNGEWEFITESFWILPHDYSEMSSNDPELYAKLGQNKLVIFKGDLNYRKLVGDIYWEPTTSFEKALRGFRPTNVLALRTIKADTICGLKKGLFEELTNEDSSWLVTGKYALIQSLKK